MRMGAGFSHFKENFSQNCKTRPKSKSWHGEPWVEEKGRNGSAAKIFTKISKLGATMHFGWFKNRKQDFTRRKESIFSQSIFRKTFISEFSYVNLSTDQEKMKWLVESEKLSKPSTRTKVFLWNGPQWEVGNLWIHNHRKFNFRQAPIFERSIKAVEKLSGIAFLSATDLDKYRSRISWSQYNI